MNQVIQPKSLSDPRPRYSQGILADGGRLLFIAGQTASDRDGNIVGKGDIEAQVAQVFERIKAVVEEAGGTMDDIVKTTIYVKDIQSQAAIHRVRSRYFKKDPPASTLIVISGLAKEEYLIEIESMAVLK